MPKPGDFKGPFQINIAFYGMSTHEVYESSLFFFFLDEIMESAFNDITQENKLAGFSQTFP